MADEAWLPGSADTALYTVETVSGFDGVVASPWSGLDAALEVTGFEAGSVFFDRLVSGTLLMVC